VKMHGHQVEVQGELWVPAGDLSDAWYTHWPSRILPGEAFLPPNSRGP
jgi:hypothetical protein